MTEKEYTVAKFSQEVLISTELQKAVIDFKATVKTAFPIKILLQSSYKGKGRPRKSDYKTAHDIMEYLDIKAYDTLCCGSTSFYTANP